MFSPLVAIFFKKFIAKKIAAKGLRFGFPIRIVQISEITVTSLVVE